MRLAYAISYVLHITSLVTFRPIAADTPRTVDGVAKGRRDVGVDNIEWELQILSLITHLELTT